MAGSALTLADSNWAVGSELDVVRQLVINTDVTLALHRDPVGEWLCLDAHTTLGGGNVGLAGSRVYDEQGLVATSSQALLIVKR